MKLIFYGEQSARTCSPVRTAMQLPLGAMLVVAAIVVPPSSSCPEADDTGEGEEEGDATGREEELWLPENAAAIKLAMKNTSDIAIMRSKNTLDLLLVALTRILCKSN